MVELTMCCKQPIENKGIAILLEGTHPKRSTHWALVHKYFVLS